MNMVRSDTGLKTVGWSCRGCKLGTGCKKFPSVKREVGGGGGGAQNILDPPFSHFVTRPPDNY